MPQPVVIEAMSAKDAADELANYEPEDVAALLLKVTDEAHVVNILTRFKEEYTLRVLQSMPPGDAAHLFLLMDSDKALSLVKMLDENSASLLEALTKGNATYTAQLVEDAVKSLIEGLSESQREIALRDLCQCLASLDADTLTELLIDMSQLPETPSTVAIILDYMDPGSVLDVVSQWISKGTRLPSLAEVFGNLTFDVLQTIYRGMSGPERALLYGYLDSSTVADLPDIGIFKVSELRIYPEEADPGQEFTVIYTLMNVGNETDDYVIPVRVDGATYATDEGLLLNGTSTTLTHTLTWEVPGIYTVTVQEQNASFKVKQVIVTPPKPASFIVTLLEIVPNILTRGEEVSVFVTLENTGEQAGQASFDLNVDSQPVDSKSIYLLAGESSTLLFTLNADFELGPHEVTVGDKTEAIEIEDRSGRFPWITLSTFIIVALSIIAYAYYKYVLNAGTFKTRGGSAGNLYTG